MWRPRTIIIFDNVYDTIYNVHTLYQDVLTDYDKAYQDALKHFDHIWTLLRRPIAADSLSIARHIDPITPVAHMEKQDYMQSVSTAIDYIYAGDAFQIVPSQRFHIDYTKDPFAFYRILRRVNPSPYMFYAECDDFILAGASPEILVRTEDRKVTIRPIAGTRPRGKNTQEDNELEQDLLNDPKECAEHLMLLDLGRNDVGRVSKIGSVDVTEEFIIERYSHVMHIVSNVEGILKEDYDFLDAIFTALPAGTVSGAPKIRAMEIINELEPEKRSFYAGGIGYFSGNGDGDFALMLRTGLIKDQKLYIQAGAGVVADSVPEKEYTETVNKAGALIKAAAIALSQI
ncbi:MAG: chorismate-binding protein, partial [Pseudomonadota bacterium]